MSDCGLISVVFEISDDFGWQVLGNKDEVKCGYAFCFFTEVPYALGYL